METHETIHRRRSIARLEGPAPSAADIIRWLDAAVMAPNHHLTQPWRFVVVGADAKDQLADAFARSAQAAGVNVAAARRLPTLAPIVIAVVDRSGNDHHVPEADERYAVGAAMQNLLLAAFADGWGSMIRTGVHVTSPIVRDHLGVKPDETLAGFVYVGRTPEGLHPGSSRRTPADELTEWRGVERV